MSREWHIDRAIFLPSVYAEPTGTSTTSQSIGPARDLVLTCALQRVPGRRRHCFY